MIPGLYGRAECASLSRHLPGVTAYFRAGRAPAIQFETPRTAPSQSPDGERQKKVADATDSAVCSETTESDLADIVANNHYYVRGFLMRCGGG